MTFQEELLIVLRRTSASGPAFLTAYQLLSKLPSERQNALLARHGRPGKGCGKHFSAASAVAYALSKIRHLVEVQHVDTVDSTYIALGHRFYAGARRCGLYRIK